MIIYYPNSIKSRASFVCLEEVKPAKAADLFTCASMFQDSLEHRMVAQIPDFLGGEQATHV